MQDLKVSPFGEKFSAKQWAEDNRISPLYESVSSDCCYRSNLKRFEALRVIKHRGCFFQKGKSSDHELKSLAILIAWALGNL